MVADEALGDVGAAGDAQVVAGEGLVEDGAGGEDAGGEVVAVRLGQELVDGGEDGLAQLPGRGGGGGGGGGTGPVVDVAGPRSGAGGGAVGGAPRRRHRRNPKP